MRPLNSSITTTAQLTALLLAGIVFVLGVASVSPDLHQALHPAHECPHHHHHDHDHGGQPEKSQEAEAHCAVHFYGQGFSLYLDLELPSYAPSISEQTIAAEDVFHQAGYLLNQRSRAPPTVLFT